MTNEHYWEIRSVLVMLSARIDTLEYLYQDKNELKTCFLKVFKHNFESSNEEIKKTLLKMFPESFEPVGGK